MAGQGFPRFQAQARPRIARASLSEVSGCSLLADARTEVDTRVPGKGGTLLREACLFSYGMAKLVRSKDVKAVSWVPK